MKTRRITLWALMIAVALAALASWGWVLRRRSASFASEAEEHEHRLAVCRFHRASIFRGYPDSRRRPKQHADGDSARVASEKAFFDSYLDPRIWPDQLVDADKERLAYYDRWISYEERLLRKYRRAAMFPWVWPEADPPPPSTSLPWR